MARIIAFPITIDQLRGGIDVDLAIEAFLSGCNQGPHRLFVTRSWLSSRLPVMRERLSNPVSAEEAELLCKVARKEVLLDTYIDWLSSEPRISWATYQNDLARKRAEEKLKAEREQELQRIQREEDRRKYDEVSSIPLMSVRGRDIINIYYNTWSACEFPPSYQLPAGGMGDMVLDGLRDRFAKLFIAALQVEMENHAGVKNLSYTSSNNLIQEFDSIWETIPHAQRRNLISRLWHNHIWLNSSVEWGKTPENAVFLVNIREFIMRKSLPINDEWHYRWLADERDNAIRNSTRNASIQCTLRWTSNRNGLLPNWATVLNHTESSIQRGSVINIICNVGNNLRYEFDVWIGADLSQNESYYYNISEDRFATVGSGNSSLERVLTVQRDWPCGNMALNVGIWYGPISDPARSVRIALAQTAITIKD